MLEHEVTDEEIERGLRISVRLITFYGDAYRPIFEKLEQELEARKTRRKKLGEYLPCPNINDGDAVRLIYIPLGISAQNSEGLPR